MKKGICALLVSSVIISACQSTIPPEALTLSPESMQIRQMQTRRFDTKDEGKILQAAAAVIQDLGFTLEESETKLGVIVGSKDRNAAEAGQIASAIIIAVLFGASVPVDAKQNIRASLVTKPVGKDGVQLRVTFQRLVWDTRNNLSKIEGLVDQKIYQEFFDKLSQSVFLTANQI